MLSYFSKKYNSVTVEYLSLSPKGKWTYVLNLAIFFQRLVGATMLDKNFKVWWYTYGLLLAFLDICLSFLYTIWYYHSDSPLKGLLFCSCLGVLIPSQMVYRMILNTSKRNKLRSMVCFSGERIYPTFETNCSRQYLEICDQHAKKLLWNTIQILGLIYFSSNIFPISMTIAYILKNEIQLPLPVIFPFTDIQSRNGIIINFANQLWISFNGVIGCICIEIPLIMFKNSVLVMAASICYAIDELSEKIVQPASARRSNVWVDAYFRNIIIQAQDFDRFLIEYSKIFYWRLLFQPLLLAFGISLALFFYLLGIWYAGIGAAIYCYTQLYMPCDIGNEVQKSNDMLLVKLQEVPWYLMSKKSQYAYAQLVYRLQNGAVVTMGPFAVLNYETLSDITKRIYSILMMLLKFDM